MTLPLLNFENHQMQDTLYIEEEIKRNKIKQREELTSNVQSSYFLSLSLWVSQETNRSRATRTETLIKEKSSNSRNF
jgi:predicted GIY-YIG superfamily endonuclease